VIDLGPAKQRAVFATLALHSGKAVSIDTLLESVWGNDPPVSSRQLVHTYVARLRRLLEPEMPPRARFRAIASTHGGYYLAAQPESVDLALFNSLCRRARRHRSVGELVPAFYLLGEAMKVWPDPTLNELANLLRTSETTDALRQNWTDAALEYVTVGLELGEAGAVLPVTQQLAAVEPMHEVIQARYLAVLEQTGRRAAAIAHFNDVREILHDELGVAPGPLLSGAYRKVLLADEKNSAGRPVGAGERTPPTRPVWRGPGPGLFPLIDRERDLEALRQVLEGDRVVTVTGPPGCGKSVLALQAAARLRDRYDGGIAVLECSVMTDPDELLAGLVRLLGGTPGVDAPSDLLGEQRMLIVLDNVECLIDFCAAVVDEVARACRYVSVVLTSREPLGLPYETIWRLAALSAPTDAAPVPPHQRPAVQLFARRATQVCPGFRLGPDNVDTVAMLCENLDDLPLAVELAAACLATDNLDELVARLTNPLHEFLPPRRGAPPHHRSLWAALRRSLDCLNEYERWCFIRLGGLPRYFRTSLARQAWACPPGSHQVPVRAMLTRLVDKSLLMVRHEPGEPSYHMTRLVHRFAIELASTEFA
jgi:predicted ATPase/DNA-binding SARP family transcriptional activator